MMGTNRSPSNRVDVCIIGSGPAGALAAHSLAKRGYEVVVLEAGERFDLDERLERMKRALRPAHGPLEVWNMGGERDSYTSVGDHYYSLNRMRVKGVGGTSLHWGGTVWRMHPADFETQTRYGYGSDWPISYEDLKPYYWKAEREIGVSGAADNPFGPPRETDFPMPAFPRSYSDRIFSAACDRLGIKLHSVPRAQNSQQYDGRNACVAYGTCSPICPAGARYSADIHVRKAEEESARVIDSVPVQKLVHNREGDRITAAVYVTPDGSTYRQKARHFILAAGGVEIPRLLLLSKSEMYPDGLANSSGLVGRYFMEHPSALISGEYSKSTNQHRIGFRTTGSQQFYGEDSKGPGSLTMAFKNTAGPSPVEVALRGGDQRPREDVFDPVVGDVWGEELLEKMRETVDRHLEISTITEQRPRKTNYVELDPSKTDNHGNPVPKISWSTDSHVASTLEFATHLGERILNEVGAKNVTSSSHLTPAHHMGTTRMGTNPNRSVVSPRLRTHDLDNLSIASSSVFVTGGAVNPTLTIAAIALMTADRVADDL